MANDTYLATIQQEITSWFQYLDATQQFAGASALSAHDFANTRLAGYALGVDSDTQKLFDWTFEHKFAIPIPDGSYSANTIEAFIDGIVKPETLTFLLEMLYGYAYNSTQPASASTAASLKLSAFPDLAALQNMVMVSLTGGYSASSAFDPSLTVDQSIAKLLQ